MLPPGPAEVTLDNVTFAYPSRPDQILLNNFSLSLPAGSSTAIIGPSGAGKSTLFALLERFYDPQHGSVAIGGRDVRSFRLSHLRGDLIAYVPQEPTLFEGSILDNIGHGISTTSSLDTQQCRDRIVSACEVANAHDFISALPQGYDTQVGRNGFQLSGGERARVALARAIVADPSVLLLDEISSNLDALSEQAVHRGLEGASKGRTTVSHGECSLKSIFSLKLHPQILVTHRLASLSTEQRVVVIEDGVKVADGTLLEVQQHPKVANMQLFDHGGTENSDAEESVKHEASSDGECARDRAVRSLLTLLAHSAKQLYVDSNSLSGDAEKEEVGIKAQPSSVATGRLRMMWRLSSGSRMLVAAGIVGCGGE